MIRVNEVFESDRRTRPLEDAKAWCKLEEEVRGAGSRGLLFRASRTLLPERSGKIRAYDGG